MRETREKPDNNNPQIESPFFFSLARYDTKFSTKNLRANLRRDSTNIKHGALLAASLKYHFPSLNNNNVSRITVLFSSVFSICLTFTLDMANMR